MGSSFIRLIRTGSDAVFLMAWRACLPAWGQEGLDSGEVKGSAWDTSPLKPGVASDA